MTPLRAPDHRSQRVIALAQQQDHLDAPNPVEVALFYLVKNGEVLDRDVAHAYSLYGTEYSRHAFSAMLLGDLPDAAILEALHITPATTAAFRHLFFDVAVFNNTFERHLYASAMPDEIYKLAIEDPNYVASRYRIGTRPALDPQVALNAVRATAYSRVLSQQGLGILDPETKEARQWLRPFLDALEVDLDRGKHEQRNAIEGLIIALRPAAAASADPTLPPEEVLRTKADAQATQAPGSSILSGDGSPVV